MEKGSPGFEVLGHHPSKAQRRVEKEQIDGGSEINPECASLRGSNSHSLYSKWGCTAFTL